MKHFRHVIFTTICLLSAVLPLSAAGRGLPEPVIPDCWGVNIHFITPDEREVKQIAAAGFRFVRMDMHWPAVEKEKGKYDFTEYDKLVKALEANGIRALFIINGTNNLHHEGLYPRTPESWRAYAAFAGACAEHYNGRGILWEVWNEPDNQVWSPSPQPEQYVSMARKARTAIKAADPGALVLGPAISQFWYPFLEPCFDAGLLDVVDVVSIHPYWSAPVPEMVIDHWAKTRKLMADRQKSLPLVSGEWGYTTTDVPEEVQAQNLVRMCLTNLLCNIRLSIWYDWRDDGTDPKNREHNFGTVRNNLEPKPSYRASQTLTSVLAGCGMQERLPARGDEYLPLLKGPKGQRLAAWTSGEAREVSIPCREPRVTVVSMLGERSVVDVREGKLTLKLTQAPIYVVAKGKRAFGGQ